MKRSDGTLFHHNCLVTNICIPVSINFSFHQRRALTRLAIRYSTLTLFSKRSQVNRSRYLIFLSRSNLHVSLFLLQRGLRDGKKEEKRGLCGWMGTARSIIKNDSQVTLINGDADEESDDDDAGKQEILPRCIVQGDVICFFFLSFPSGRAVV